MPVTFSRLVRDFFLQVTQKRYKRRLDKFLFASTNKPVRNLLPYPSACQGKTSGVNMLHREAAVRISQSVETVLSELRRALYHCREYESEGKVTPDEATNLNEEVKDSVTILLDGVLEPIYTSHPDLRPRCCGCPPIDESE